MNIKYFLFLISAFFTVSGWKNELQLNEVFYDENSEALINVDYITTGCVSIIPNTSWMLVGSDAYKIADKLAIELMVGYQLVPVCVWSNQACNWAHSYPQHNEMLSNFPTYLPFDFFVKESGIWCREGEVINFLHKVGDKIGVVRLQLNQRMFNHPASLNENFEVALLKNSNYKTYLPSDHDLLKKNGVIN